MLFRSRDLNLDIIPGAREYRMATDFNGEVKIAGRAAVDAGVALACEPNPLSVTGSRFDTSFNRLCTGHRSFATAGCTIMRVLARSATLRALDLEFHAATHLGDLACALAFGAGRAAAARFSFAGRADFLARYLETHHSATDGGPEVDSGCVF